MHGWGWGKFHNYLNSGLDLKIRSEMFKVETVGLILWVKIWEYFLKLFGNDKSGNTIKYNRIKKKKSLLLLKENTLFSPVDFNVQLK